MGLAWGMNIEHLKIRKFNLIGISNPRSENSLWGLSIITLMRGRPTTDYLLIYLYFRDLFETFRNMFIKV